MPAADNDAAAQRALMQGLYRQTGKKTWWLRFTPVTGGKRIQISLGTRDLQEAIAKAKLRRGEITARERRRSQACTQEIQRYLDFKAKEGCSKSTLESRRYVLNAFVAEIEVENPRQISTADVQRWFTGRLHRMPHTAIAYLHQVRWWLRWLITTGVLTRDPSADIRPPKVRPRVRKTFLRPDQARQLIEAAGDDVDMKFALYCGLHAGLRKLEVIEARPEWFDLEHGLLHVQTTPTFTPKDRDDRTIPLTDEFAAWLRATGLRSPFMLRPDVEHGKYRYRFDFLKAYERVKKLAGVTCTFHDLRRTFASLLVSKGVSLYKVAKWLGDELDTVQNHYGHLIPQDTEVNKAWS